MRRDSRNCDGAVEVPYCSRQTVPLGNAVVSFRCSAVQPPARWQSQGRPHPSPPARGSFTHTETSLNQKTKTRSLSEAVRRSLPRITPVFPIPKLAPVARQASQASAFQVEVLCPETLPSRRGRFTGQWRCNLDSRLNLLCHSQSESVPEF
jgi:hypothetical protein